MFMGTDPRVTEGKWPVSKVFFAAFQTMKYLGLFFWLIFNWSATGYHHWSIVFGHCFYLNMSQISLFKSIP